jgi:tripartite-type tricarboxylate transporter receptor subunit TctC
MLVNPSVPVKTVAEFIAYAKTAPGKITMASSGIGTPSHIFGELFKLMAGVNLVDVPYRGAAPSITDLLGGQVQVNFNAPSVSLAYIKTGGLRALAVTTATRWDGLPDIPTVGDFVPGYEASNWYGLGAPKNTPATNVCADHSPTPLPPRARPKTPPTEPARSRIPPRRQSHPTNCRVVGSRLTALISMLKSPCLKVSG